MSFRISWYCVPKHIVDENRDLSESDENFDDKFDKFYNEIYKDEMMYDFMTYDIMESSEHELYTRLFNNHLECECDLFFGTCSKEQLIKIIDIAKGHIIKNYSIRNIDKDGNCEMISDYHYPNCNSIEDVKEYNQNEVRHKLMGWFNDFNIDINLDHKWKVSSSWSYEYGIFDLIHILKTFDFENNYIVFLGG